MLVPSAGETVATSYPAQDYRQLLSAANRHGVGSIGVRVLAGGALSGTEIRHPLGIQNVTPDRGKPRLRDGCAARPAVPTTYRFGSRGDAT